MQSSQWVHRAFMPITFDGEETPTGREQENLKGVCVYCYRAQPNAFIKNVHFQKMSARKLPTTCQQAALLFDDGKTCSKACFCVVVAGVRIAKKFE